MIEDWTDYDEAIWQEQRNRRERVTTARIEKLEAALNELIGCVDLPSGSIAVIAEAISVRNARELRAALLPYERAAEPACN